MNMKKVYEIALETVAEKLFDMRMLFANIDFDPTPENAVKCGLESYYKKYCEYQEIMAFLKQELVDIEENQKKHWSRIALVLDGKKANGSIYICPHCNHKSPDDYIYCPTCGKYVGRGIEG